MEAKPINAEFEAKRKEHMGKWIKDGDQDGDQHDLNEDIEATYAKQDE